MDTTKREQLEQGLRDRPDFLAGIIASAMDAIIATDDAQRIVLFNAAAERMFGCPADEAIGTSIDRFIPQRFRAEHSRHVRRFGESGATNRKTRALGTLWGLRSTGEEFPIEAAISKVEAGGAKFLAVVIRDLTERHRAEETVRESEQRFRLVADTAPVLIWISGTDRLCTYFNKPWLDFTGRSMDSELGNGWAEGVHPEDMQRCLDIYTQSFDRREKFRMEYRLRRHDGEYRWILDVGVPRFAENGSFAGYIGIGVDVTERKQTEEALRESEERDRHLVESANDWVWEVNANVEYTYVGPQCRKILGYEAEEIIGKTPFDLMPPEEARRVAAVFAPIAAERKPFRALENINRHKDGHLVSLETNGAPVINREGEFLGYRGMDRDITERKRAEEALRESEARYEQLAEQSRTTHWEVDLQGLFTHVSHVSEASWGYRPEEVVNRIHFYDLHPEDGRDAFKAAIFAFAERKQPFRDVVHPVETKDGRITWGSLSGIPVLNNDGTLRGYRGSCTDITERKSAEEALRESEEKFRRVVEHIGDALFVDNVEGQIVFANERFLNLFGYSREELPDIKLEDYVAPEYRATLRDRHDRRVRGEVVPTHFEYEGFRRDGKRMWLEVDVVPVTDENGNLIGTQSALREITERKRAEEALSGMARKLVEAQEQERARIARELHDDINQRLAMLAVELEQLKENPSEVESRAEELRKQTSEISNGVQALSHDLHSSQLEYLGVVAGMKSWCKEFAGRQKIEIECRHDVRSTLPPEIELCLFRVLQEALHNAVKHSGVNRIEVQLREQSGEIHLIVSDSGRGFDIEAIKQGKGLGLISMRERVRLVNGTIDIESKPMGGTIVHARVPFRSEQLLQRAAG